MRIYLSVTIDCECDKGPRWICQEPLSFAGVLEGMRRRLHPLFVQHQAKPTYLLSAEVMRHEASVSWLQAIAAEAELGTHLHGEFVDPGGFVPKVTSAFQSDYSPELELAKLGELTTAFSRAFGRAPRAFRAGRFGIGPHSLAALQQLGYWVDSSVTPHVDWTPIGGPCFCGAPTQPYWPDPARPAELRADSVAGDIVEVPVTIRRSWPSRLPFLGRHMRQRWLRPTWGSVAALLSVAKEEIAGAAAAGREVVVLNCMFHNVEIVPGASPYAASEAAARAILRKLEALLSFATREGISVVGLSDLRELMAAQRPA